MSINDIFNLKGIDSVFEATAGNEVADSVVEFLNWGLLQRGNFFNISLGELDSEGVDRSQLISVNENGQVWSSYKSNWVWEPEVTFDPPPTYVSGVYIDDVFHPSDTTGQFAHNIDYFSGNLVFDSPISTGSKVQVEHSHKWINVDYIDFEGIKEIISGKHDNKILQDFTPFIGVDVMERPSNQGYSLGGGQILRYMILLYCIADSKYIRNRLVDILSYQNDKNIVTFDSNRVISNGDKPTNINGFLNPGAKNYPQIVTQYPEYVLRLQNFISTSMEIPNNRIFGATVKFEGEIIKLDI